MFHLSFPHSWFITGFAKMSLVEQELAILSKYLSSPPVLSGVRVILPLALCVWFVDHCLSFFRFFFLPLCCLFFCLFAVVLSGLLSFCRCVVCSSWYTDSDYPIDIFKLFFVHNISWLFDFVCIKFNIEQKERRVLIMLCNPPFYLLISYWYQG